MRVYTDIHNLDLIFGLKLAIAQHFPELTADSIPLSLSFQRQGLGIRSAVLLQWSATQKIALKELREKALQNFSCAAIPSDQEKKAWQFQLTVTGAGWLEFQLSPQSLEIWLDRCLQYLVLPQSEVIACLNRVEPPRFAWQYLQQRCRSLGELAQDVADQGSPQWQFTEYAIPAWEQTLLDATARLFLALLNDQRGDRPLKTITIELNTIEKAFWEFHRHCHLFAFYPAQPEKFWHYCAWIKLVEAIARVYLGAATAEKS